MQVTEPTGNKHTLAINFIDDEKRAISYVDTTHADILLVHNMLVHPHVRGEHIFLDLSFIAPIGSSPHPWGTLGGDFNANNPIRFIPTSVGNTLSISACF